MAYNPFDDDVLTQPMLDAIKAHQVTGADKRLHSLAISVFIGLPEREAKEWPLQYCHALKGKDSGQVVDHFMIWLLVDEQHGVLRFAKDKELADAIEEVATLYKYRLRGHEPVTTAWSNAAQKAACASDEALLAAEMAASAATAGTAAAWGEDEVPTVVQEAAAAANAETKKILALAEKAKEVAAEATVAADTAVAAAAAQVAAWAKEAARATAAEAHQEKYYVAMRDKLLELIEAAPMHPMYE